MTAFFEKYHGAVAVSIVLLFLVVLISALLFTWGIIQAKQAEIDARQTQLQALQRRAAMPPPSAGTQTEHVDPFFGDGSFALAANELRQRVVEQIENADGTLVSVGTDPQVTADDEFSRRVVVQAVAELTNDGLQQVLYELEAAAPFVFVDTLQVTRVTRSIGEGEEFAFIAALDGRSAGRRLLQEGGHAMIRLTISMIVAALALPCAAAAQSAPSDQSVRTLAMPPLEELNATRDRPLFAPSRRPDTKVAAPAEQAAIEEPPAAVPFDLTGIVMGEDHAVAILQNRDTPGDFASEAGRKRRGLGHFGDRPAPRCAAQRGP